MKKISFFSLSILMVGIFCCLSCGCLISNVLLSSSIFNLHSTVTSESHTLFAISTKKSENAADLEDEKLTLQSQNGGGVIFENDGRFFLLASAYENLPDAEKVKNNLKSQNIDSEIVKLEVKAQTLEGNFKLEEKNILTNCLKSKFNLYKSLYDVAISLDTNVFDVKKAKLECNNIFSKHVENKTNFETFFKNPTGEILNLNNSLKIFFDLLNDLIGENFENNNQTFSSLIKMTYLKILIA